MCSINAPAHFCNLLWMGSFSHGSHCLMITIILSQRLETSGLLFSSVYKCNKKKLVQCKPQKISKKKVEELVLMCSMWHYEKKWQKEFSWHIIISLRNITHLLFFEKGNVQFNSLAAWQMCFLHCIIFKCESMYVGI